MSTLQEAAAVAVAASQSTQVLQGCLVLHGAGGTLPRMTMTLTPDMLGLSSTQASAMRGAVTFGEVYLFPKEWIAKLGRPRARVGSWLANNRMPVPALGYLVPAGRWAPPDYDPSQQDWSKRHVGIYSTFREVFDWAQYSLNETVEAMIENYDNIVLQKRNECFEIAQSVYDSIIREMQVKPDEFEDLNPTQTTNGWVPTMPNGTIITSSIFAEMYWSRIRSCIPSPLELRKKSTLYYEIDPVPLEAYEAKLESEALRIFNEDLATQRQEKLASFDTALESMMQQIYQRILVMTNNLIRSIQEHTEFVPGRTMMQLRGLVTHLQACNLLDDPKIEDLAALLAEHAGDKNRDHTTLTADLQKCLDHTMSLLSTTTGSTIEWTVIDSGPSDIPSGPMLDMGEVLVQGTGIEIPQ